MARRVDINAMGAAIGWFLVSLALGPGLVLIHELGHAFATVLLTGQRTLVTVGSGERYAGLRVGRVRIRLYGNSDDRWCEVTPNASPRDWFVIALAGPAASFLSAVVLAVAFITVGRPVVPYLLLGLGTLMALMLSLGNLVPRQAEDEASDGWYALTTWRRWRGKPEWRMPLQQLLRQEDRPLACRPLLKATVDEARMSQTPYVGTEHLLIAVADSESEAGRVLRAAGLTPARIRGALPSDQDGLHAAEPRNTPAIVRVYRAAPSHLSLRGDQEVAPEHLLLALLHEKGGRAFELVDALGSSPAELRSALLSAMARPRG